MDRVLDPAFVADMGDIAVEELRERRDMARQEEADLSYLRRMLQGRIEIVGAELVSDEADSDQSLVDRLTSVLTLSVPSQGGQARVTQEPTRMEENQRYAERLVADVGLSASARVDGEQAALVLRRLKQEERSVSELRAQVHDVIHALTMELGNRYRTGEAAPPAS